MSNDASVLNEIHSIGGSGRFMLCDPKEGTERLLKTHKGGIQLVYIDPPQAKKSYYSYSHSGSRKRIAIPNDIINDKNFNYAYMRDLIESCHKLLSPSGSAYIYCTQKNLFAMLSIMNEIFGERNCVNQIILTFKAGGRSTSSFSKRHDILLFYRKSRELYFNINEVGRVRGAVARNHMKRIVDESGKTTFSARTQGRIYKYAAEALILPDDVWQDSELNELAGKDTQSGYSVLRPPGLSHRLLLASTKEGDTVFAPFTQGGTFIQSAMQLGRKWIASDCSPVSAALLRNRLFSTSDLIVSGDNTVIFENCSERKLAGAKKYCTIKRDEAKTSVILSNPAESAPLIYAAIGRINDSSFYPESCAIKPHTGYVLSSNIPFEDAVLMLCTVKGDSAVIFL